VVSNLNWIQPTSQPRNAAWSHGRRFFYCEWLLSGDACHCDAVLFRRGLRRRELWWRDETATASLHPARLIRDDYNHGCLWWYADKLTEAIGPLTGVEVQPAEAYDAMQGAARRLVEVGNATGRGGSERA